MWYWSADTLFWQLSIDDNIDVPSASSWAPKVARKCESKHWYVCGADGRSVGRSVTWLPNFLGWVYFLSNGALPTRALRARVELRINSFQRALLWQSLGIWIFSSCTRIRCIYRKSLLNHIVFVCGCRWPPLAGTISMGRAFLCIPRRPHLGNLSGLLKPEGEVPVVQMVKVKPSTNIGWVRF